MGVPPFLFSPHRSNVFGSGDSELVKKRIPVRCIKRYQPTPIIPYMSTSITHAWILLSRLEYVYRVLFPIMGVMVLVGILRNNVTMLLTTAPKSTLKQIREK